MVKAMLCIMYTGTAKIQWKALQEINNGFKLIGFCGKDLTANPYQNADSSNDITIAYSAAKSKLAAQDFTQIKISDDVMPLFDGKPDPDLVAAGLHTNPYIKMIGCLFVCFSLFIVKMAKPIRGEIFLVGVWFEVEKSYVTT